MTREVDEAAYNAERREKAYRKSDPQRAVEVHEELRLLKAVSFFLHHTAKAHGLTPYEFRMMRPIAASLVERHIWRSESLMRFDLEVDQV